MLIDKIGQKKEEEIHDKSGLSKAKRLTRRNQAADFSLHTPQKAAASTHPFTLDLEKKNKILGEVPVGVDTHRLVR